MPPNRKAAHGSGKTSHDDTRQAVFIAEVRLVIPSPAPREGLSAGKAASGENHTARAEDTRDCLEIFETVGVAHLLPRAAIGIGGICRDVDASWSSGRDFVGQRLAVISFKTTNGRLLRAGLRDDFARRDEGF